MNMKKSLNVRELTRAALIAAIYCVVTILWPFSFGSIQVRISEALTLLPVLFPAAIPGVSVGCMLAGILTGAPWFDWLFGDHRRDRPFRLCGQPHAFPFAAYDALRRRGRGHRVLRSGVSAASAASENRAVRLHEEGIISPAA